MHAVVRKYSGQGAKELLDLLARNVADLDKHLRAVPGFVSYTLSRTADGGIAVTVCQDKAGTDASSAVAREWIAKNAKGIIANPPEISSGDVILHLK